MSGINLGILFVEECNKARSIMTAIAFRRKNKPAMKSADAEYPESWIINVLSWFKLGKLTTFEQNVKCLPNRRRSWRGTVESVGAKRKSSPDRLVNINHLNDVNTLQCIRVAWSLTITDIIPTIHRVSMSRITSNDISSHLKGLMTVVFPSGFTKHGPFSENEYHSLNQV